MSDINFSAAPINPMPGMMQALQFGQAIGGMRDQRQAAQQAAQAKAESDRRIAEGRQLIINNPSGENYAKVASMMPPADYEAMSKSIAQLDADTQKASLQEGIKVFAAVKSGNTQLAKDLFDIKLEAYKNAGNEEAYKKTKALRDALDVGEVGQKAVEDYFGITLSFMPGGKDAIDAVAKLDENWRANDLHGLNKAKLQADIDKLNSERDPALKLSEPSLKLINDSVVKAIDADKAAVQYDNLATAFDSLKPPSGWGAGFLEQLKKASGGQDRFTALKQEYVKLRNTEALKNLPPGVASDKDIEVAMSAFPDETSNPDLIASFMRGTAKLQRYTSAVEKAKAEWLNQNGSLGNARKDFTAAGKPVESGTAFWDFTSDIEVPNIVGTGKAPTQKPVATQPKVTEVDF